MRTGRKPNGYWRDFDNVKSVILEVEEKLGHYPTREELSDNGYSTLSAIISKYHGGSEEVKKSVMERLQINSPSDDLEQFLNNYVGGQND